MELIVTLVVAVLVFCLLWWAITMLPLPAGAPRFARTVLLILLLVVAAVWLWTKFVR